MAIPAVGTSASFTHCVQLGLIVPLALERQCLRATRATHSGTIVSISQSGQGADNAARAAQTAIDRGATALMSVGVGGALIPGLAAGDIVIPDTVVDADSGHRFECARAWAAALRSRCGALGGVHSGTLLGVSRVLAVPADKAAAASQHEAIACDMESAALAAAAQRAQIHFAALRVISDASSDELPHDVSAWVDDAGNARMRPVLHAMLSPGRWRSVVSMTVRFRLAQRRLRQLSERLAIAAYCCPQS